MVILIGLAAVLFQALMFELDVFNKSYLGRYELIRQARIDAPETEPDWQEYEISGEQLQELIPYPMYGESDIGDLQYGPKTLKMRKGTKYWDPLAVPHEDWQFAAAILLLDHIEDSPVRFSDGFELLRPVIDSIQSVMGSF